MIESGVNVCQGGPGREPQHEEPEASNPNGGTHLG